ncbi:MAG: hypothetical protein AB1597_07130 [Chloroflexota bacterium]
MAPEIGQIEKPAADQYKSSRKIYIVPLVLHSENSPEEYKEKCRRYWLEVMEHISNLESKLGPIRRIYHESIVVDGEEGVAVMEKFNPAGREITRTRCQAGASFELAEDRSIAEEAMDWERCLMLGFVSEKVASKVSEAFNDAARRRWEHIAARINQTLKEGEAGVLFIREGHRVQFPASIDVFIVFPPALNDIQRWLREQVEKRIAESPSTAGDETSDTASNPGR